MSLDAMLLRLAVCLCAEVSKVAPLCRCGLVLDPSPPWDECAGCDEGIGWVALAGVFPSVTFPSQAEFSHCRTPLAALVTVGVLRPSPPPQPDGSPPPEDDVTEAALVNAADVLAIHKAISCCLSEGEAKYHLMEYTPLPEGGMCFGGQWTVAVEV